MSIRDIKGLTAPGFNLEYQALIVEAVYKAILEATMDPDTRQAFVRNEDVIYALLDLQALFASTSTEMSSPTKIREYSVELSKRFRSRLTEAKAAKGSFVDEIIPAARNN